jgi:hypothetical protein
MQTLPEIRILEMRVDMFVEDIFPPPALNSPFMPELTIAYANKTGWMGKHFRRCVNDSATSAWTRINYLPWGACPAP